MAEHIPTPLDGYKSYIVMVAGIGLSIFFFYNGAIDGPTAFNTALAFLGFGTLSHKMERLGNGG